MTTRDRGDARRGRYRDDRPQMPDMERYSNRRTMPHNLDAEHSILGGVLLRNEVLALLPMLDVDDFYDPRAKVVWQAMRNLEAASKPIDVVTVEVEIEKGGKLDAIGGVAFLGELALRVPTPDNVEEYAKITVEHRITRDTMLLCAEFLESGYAREREGEEYINDLSGALMQIRTGRDVPIVTMADLAKIEGDKALADIESRAQGVQVYAGVPTGIHALDERCGGHPIGVLTMYIARPATGKTTFAMAVAKASKLVADMDSAICSYEDGGTSFGQRALGQETGLATEQIRARRFANRDEIGQFVRGVARARKRDELFMFCAGMEVEELVRRIRRENVLRKGRGQKPLRQIIIDYIQKMPMPKWARTRDEGIGHISRVLSDFAATDELAVVVMSQLNRESEKRDDHRPRLSDIRDSGALEQDGKLILGIYYPYGYEGAKGNATAEDVYLLLLKNAQGEANLEIPLYWDRATHAIYNSPADYHAARLARR